MATRWTTTFKACMLLCVSVSAWLAAKQFASNSSANSTLPLPLAPTLSSAASLPGAEHSPDLAAALAIAQSVCDPVLHVCRRNLSLEELTLLLTSGTPQYISRLLAGQQRYLQAQDSMRSEYRSVSDHIREHKFGAACTINTEGKKQCEFNNEATAGGADDADPSSFVFPNDFPYALDPPLSHSVIWTRRALGSSDSPDVLRLVERHFPASRFETRHLVNPVALQSIKDVYHIHVFHKPRNAGTEEEGVD